MLSFKTGDFHERLSTSCRLETGPWNVNSTTCSTGALLYDTHDRLRPTRSQVFPHQVTEALNRCVCSRLWVESESGGDYWHGCSEAAWIREVIKRHTDLRVSPPDQELHDMTSESREKPSKRHLLRAILKNYFPLQLYANTQPTSSVQKLTYIADRQTFAWARTNTKQVKLQVFDRERGGKRESLERERLFTINVKKKSYT